MPHKRVLSASVHESIRLIGYRCCPLLLEDGNGWQTEVQNSPTIAACRVAFRGVAPHARSSHSDSEVPLDRCGQAGG
jgi:hypothetical protein